MTDLTPLLNELLKSHEAPPTVQYSLSTQDLNTFLKEAYTINSLITNLHKTLKELRTAYLSTATAPRRGASSTKEKYMTDYDKEATDAWAKKELRVLNGTITILADSEVARQQTETLVTRTKFSRKGLGALGKWAAGGVMQNQSAEERAEELKARELREHRESILWYLRLKLQKCSQDQASMMEKRIKREIEKKKSILAAREERGMPELGGFANAPVPPKASAATTAVSHTQQFQPEEELTPEQVQMFEKDNQDMLKHYQETFEQVRDAEKSLIEISGLQSEIVNNLEIQSEHIAQLGADAFLTAENVGGGNKELKKASERKSTAKYVFYASCSLSLFLVVWDLVI